MDNQIQPQTDHFIIEYCLLPLSFNKCIEIMLKIPSFLSENVCLHVTKENIIVPEELLLKILNGQKTAQMQK